MSAPSEDRSLGHAVTFAGAAKQPAASRDVSLGDERTLFGDMAIDATLLDDIEIVDLAARYTIEAALGQGGMGAVLLATDTRLGRKVAIKRILGEAARSKAAIARFLTEARAIAAISHPNVVQIYELGVANDGPFLVIEYIDGGSLLDRCKGGAIPLEEAVEVFCQVCEGLARAHDIGIVHRDIKPANILLTKDGTPKLTDFGLAKAESSDHQMTMAGPVMGTPDFMPPEQRRDAALVDHRSDLWSLAATLYQAVSGRSPKVIRLHELPPELQPIIAKALEDEKDARYQSAQEFRDVLKGIGSGGRRQAAPAQFEGVLQEGQCKACGTVNETARKFCRNPRCGAGLRVTCLKCEAQIPVWDAICGECGGRQPALLAAKRESLSAARAEAEALLAGFAFDEAIARARLLADEASADLAEFAAWGGEFVASATAERDRQRSFGEERQRDARTHLRAWDYPAAIQAIESIPAPLRDAATTALLEQCGERKRESDELIATIADRIRRKDLAGLLPVVERAVSLRGDRKDLATIRDQLAQRLAGQIARARTAMEAGDALAAAQALAGAAVEDLGADVQLLDQANIAVAKEQRLIECVRASKADGVVSVEEAREIQRLGAECLAVNPRNENVKRLVKRAVEIVAGKKAVRALEEIRRPGEPADTAIDPPPESVMVKEAAVAVDAFMPTLEKQEDREEAVEAADGEEDVAQQFKFEEPGQGISPTQSVNDGRPFIAEFPYGNVNVFLIFSAFAVAAFGAFFTFVACLDPWSKEGFMFLGLGVLCWCRLCVMVHQMVSSHFRSVSVLLDASTLTIPRALRRPRVVELHTILSGENRDAGYGHVTCRLKLEKELFPTCILHSAWFGSPEKFTRFIGMLAHNIRICNSTDGPSESADE